MLESGTVGEFLGMGDIHQLGTFTLSGGIGSQNHKTVGDQIQNGTLIGVTCFAVDRVSGKEEHGRSVGSAFGDVQVGGDGKTGAAVIDHIFHSEAFTLKDIGHSGGKRSLFSGELEGKPDLLFQFLLIGFELFGCLDLIQTCFAFCEIGTKSADVIILNLVSEKLLHNFFSFYLCKKSAEYFLFICFRQGLP